MNQPQSTKPKPDTGQANGTEQDLKHTTVPPIAKAKDGYTIQPTP
jgi:hypothetical protein